MKLNGVRLSRALVAGTVLSSIVGAPLVAQAATASPAPRTGVITATSRSATTTTTTTAAAASTAAAEPGSVLRLNSGGPLLTEAGLSWKADQYAVGGAVATAARPVADTDSDVVVQSVRWGMSGYKIPVAAVGTYRVSLDFVEMAWPSAGRRVFSVTGEGAPLATDLDVFAVAGRDRAHRVTRDVVVKDGVLDLGFTATKDNAMVSAISVETLKTAVPIGVGSQFHCMWSGASGYGSSTFDATRGAVLDKLVAAGVKKVRIDVGWDGLQPTSNVAPDPAGWYVKLLDGCVSGARARGLQVLLTLHMAPKWARPAAYAGTAMVLPENPAAIKTASAFLASRYASQAYAIEVWNEPNLRSFVQVVDPAKYVAVLGAAHSAIKAANPAMKVMFAGTDRIAVQPGGSVVDDFYSLAYKAGAKGKFDIMGVHTYQGPADASPDAADVGTWRILHMPHLIRLMAAYGDAALPISVSEFGWSVHANAAGTATWDLGVSEQQQADYTLATFDILSQWPQVQDAFVYAERQKATGNLHQDGYGLLKRDLTPRPVYNALLARKY